MQQGLDVEKVMVGIKNLNEYGANFAEKLYDCLKLNLHMLDKLWLLNYDSACKDS